MTDDDGELRETTVRHLEALGLNEYAARTLVALTALGRGSARAVSEASSVPRTRVYDAVEELSDHGFVTVHGTDPKEFVPVIPDRIRRGFLREYAIRLSLAVWGLTLVSPSDRDYAGQDVAIESDSVATDRRMIAAVEGATEGVTYITIEKTPSGPILDAMAVATDRGLDVRVVALGAVDLDAVRETVPAASLVELLDERCTSCDPTRLLFVDRKEAYVGISEAGRTDGEVGLVGEPPNETVTALLSCLVDVYTEEAR